MSLGIRQLFVLNQAFSKTADVAPTVVQGATSANQLSCAIAANQTMIFDAYLPLTIGAAAGGWRAQVTVPAAGTAFSATFEVIDETTNAYIAVIKQVASAVVNGVGIAADGCIRIRGTVVNGATAGNVQIVFAQSASNGAASTIDRGAWLQTTIA
jgi:hypothetical protein